jgi:histidinol-phosphate aminotransferase
LPFSVTSVSQAAAIASLDAADELLARTDALVAERARVASGLREAGYTVPPTQTNFVWLPLGPRTIDFVQQAASERLVVRPFAPDGVRITVGAPEENDALLRFARDWISHTQPEE